MSRLTESQLKAIIKEEFELEQSELADKYYDLINQALKLIIRAGEMRKFASVELYGPTDGIKTRLAKERQRALSQRRKYRHDPRYK